jgi:hypothetical protein
LGLSVRATLHVNDGAPASLPADVLDISLGGAKLLVDAPVPFQKAVELRLVCVERDLKWNLSGEVRWQRPHPRQGWRLGCAFSPSLSPEKLNEMFALSVVERRKFRRRDVGFAVTADWELGPRGEPATLCDVSEGGFSLTSAFAGQPGARLRLVFGPATPASPARTVAGIVRWQRPLGHRGSRLNSSQTLDPAETSASSSTGQWLVGCEFTDRAGFHMLRDAVFPIAGPSPARGKRGGQRLSQGLVRMADAMSWLLPSRWVEE